MIFALLNDILQRILTFNKWDQKRYLRRWVSALKLSPGSRVLDFGCGTGLFEVVFRRLGLSYVGYDIEPRLTKYASMLYRRSAFTHELGTQSIPFDLVVANCCFHHISDEGIDQELDRLKKKMTRQGRFLLIDLLLPTVKPGWIRRQFLKLERGAHVRPTEAYRKLIEKHFVVLQAGQERSNVFSLPGNPAYNDLCVLLCAVKDA